ncbi:hypothetical protein E3P92_03124 [Wallemia ichthyophaga]|uniref:Uncharacterized protein n=2 Tax=Wallemia ichthyophaga TaxID=245174 RepID=A0A4T0JY00_WALIC|nr:Chitin synthase export chaperone [Wallemia ichthyophaga EXF-994]TIA71003.1 hypothetical protein E3P91_02760 [Wallemia ichthyophaga]EOQ99984.1 Chitin synthase export chaperone [Wallemia ichthyophaga EXF-994]TIA80197.1 hypothetical protein E3P98_02855 [Wallemia ichthyophaga]TIA89413.1 hypothetical protein E3P97_03036 [Wallemia ichthyophaga]TIA97674.1 hypothetical protein E3P95_02751 [Wallemia ichthyophaga]
MSLQHTKQFGSWEFLCSHSPSLAPCNLFFNQIQSLNSSDTILYNSTSFSLVSNNLQSAGVGVRPTCFIRRAGHEGGLGNIAQIVATALCFVFSLILFAAAKRRIAAVGRVEFATLLGLWALIDVFSLLTTGSFLQQGSDYIVWLTSIQMGLRSAWFWSLIVNGLNSTQLIEDGTPPSILSLWVGGIAFFVGTGYIAVDTAFNWSGNLPPSNPPEYLLSNGLFVLLLLWPMIAVFIYSLLMTYVIFFLLKESIPAFWFSLSLLSFMLSQAALFALGHTICDGTNSRIDGAFVATLLEAISLGLLFAGWRSITEDSWYGYDGPQVPVYPKQEPLSNFK